MTVENGKLLCDATTGKLLCHPTTGKLLYGIEAKLVFDGDLVIVTNVLVTIAVLDTIILRNPMTIPVDWELTITLDAALSGLVTFDPLTGTLVTDEEKTITMTLSDPSALAVGAYAGTIVATDLAGVSTSDPAPVSITVQGGILEFTGNLVITSGNDVSTPVTDNISLGNIGYANIDWELAVTLDAALSGLVTFLPLSGDLDPSNNVSIVMTLSDPSALAVGSYAGTIVASDVTGFADSVSAPVSITIEETFPVFDVTGTLDWTCVFDQTPVVKQISVGNSAGASTTLNWAYEVTGDLAGHVTLNPTTGSRAGGTSETVDVTLDYSDLDPAGSYTGKLKLYDTVESETDVPPFYIDITVEISVPKYLVITATGTDWWGVSGAPYPYPFQVDQYWTYKGFYSSPNGGSHVRYIHPSGTYEIAWKTGGPWGYRFYLQNPPSYAYVVRTTATDTPVGRYNCYTSSLKYYDDWIEMELKES